MKKGFTLVELSIVLVIIGLLIGGILAAQSMINTAKIAAAVQQFSHFDAAVMNFKTKYKYLPGDAPVMGVISGACSGNGLIDDCSYGPEVNSFNCEIASFWGQLFPGEYVAQGCNATPPWTVVTSGSTKNAPLSKIGSKGAFIIASALSVGGGSSTPDTTKRENYYFILGADQIGCDSGFPHFSNGTCSAGNVTNGSSVKPADVLAMDTKMDDGIANNGNVKAGSLSGAWNGAGIFDTTTGASCSTTTTYNSSTTTEACLPLIRIGGVAGDPQ